MSNSRVAHRYARPLLELAEEQGVLEQVKTDMLSIGNLCESNREFTLMLKSPIIPHQKKAEILKAIFVKRVHPLTSKFLEIITRKNRENVVPDVALEFAHLYNDKMGFQEATVVSSLQLDKSARTMVEKLVSDISGKKAILKEKLNPELIGGYILKLGDLQIDDSVSGKLNDLKIRFHKENR